MCLFTGNGFIEGGESSSDGACGTCQAHTEQFTCETGAKQTGTAGEASRTTGHQSLWLHPRQCHAGIDDSLSLSLSLRR